MTSNYMVREASVDQSSQLTKKKSKQKTEAQSKKRPKTNITDGDKQPKANVKRNPLIEDKHQS